jgi:hypothetical protein
MDNVGLHHQVLVDEFSRVGVIGMDTAYASSREKHVLGLFGLEKCSGGAGVREIQLSVGAQQEVIETVCLKYSHQRGANQATVTGDVDAVGEGESVWAFRHGLMVLKDRSSMAGSGKSRSNDPDHARVQNTQFRYLPVGRMGRYRKVVVVVWQLKHLAQVEFCVVTEACAGIRRGMLALANPEFSAVKTVGFLTGSISHVDEDFALIVLLG